MKSLSLAPESPARTTGLSAMVWPELAGRFTPVRSPCRPRARERSGSATCTRAGQGGRRGDPRSWRRPQEPRFTASRHTVRKPAERGLQPCRAAPLRHRPPGHRGKEWFFDVLAEHMPSETPPKRCQVLIAGAWVDGFVLRWERGHDDRWKGVAEYRSGAEIITDTRDEAQLRAASGRDAYRSASNRSRWRPRDGLSGRGAPWVAG
jgi:hypothetical protein